MAQGDGDGSASIPLGHAVGRGAKSDGGRVIVIGDGQDRHAGRAQSSPIGVAQGQGQGFIRLVELIVSDRHLEALAGLTRGEGQGATGGAVITARRSPAIAGGIVYSDGLVCRGAEVDGDSNIPDPLSHAIGGGVESGRRWRIIVGNKQGSYAGVPKQGPVGIT